MNFFTNTSVIKLNDNYKAESFCNSTPFPYRVTWDMTYRCNLLCKHCFVIHQNEAKNVIDSIETNSKILEQILQVKPFIVSLAGGEPLMVPNINKIIKKLCLNDIQVTIATNGLLVTEDLLQDLSGLNKLYFQISLDGATKQTHDNIRGKDTYESVISAISLLSKQLPTTIAFTLTNKSIYEIEEIFALANKLNVDALKFQKMILTQNVPDMSLGLSPSEINYAKDKIQDILNEKNNFPFSVIHPFVDDVNDGNKKAIRQECTINPAGKIYTCGAALSEGYVGSLIEENFESLWKRTKASCLVNKNVSMDCKCNC